MSNRKRPADRIQLCKYIVLKCTRCTGILRWSALERSKHAVKPQTVKLPNRLVRNRYDITTPAVVVVVQRPNVLLPSDYWFFDIEPTHNYYYNIVCALEKRDNIFVTTTRQSMIFHNFSGAVSIIIISTSRRPISKSHLLTAIRMVIITKLIAVYRVSHVVIQIHTLAIHDPCKLI